MKKPEYSFAEHVHNFAVWTSARAVQRGFKGASTDIISNAIGTSSLRSLLNGKVEINSSKQSDSFHKRIANQLIRFFENNGIECSYGRAAKIMALYIKTAIVLPEKGKGGISEFAHPPIDRILLQNLGYKSTNWTVLDETEYFDLIGELRTRVEGPFWQLEEYWRLF